MIQVEWGKPYQARRKAQYPWKKEERKKKLIDLIALFFLKRDFPGSPVVWTSPFNMGGMGSIPGQGIKIPHASLPGDQNRTEVIL